MLLFFFVVSCGNTGWFCRKKPSEPVLGQGKTMVSVYNMGITNAQLDSICLADTLSLDFNGWINAYYIDYETRDTVFKHTYIKHAEKRNETIYIVTEWRDSLAINKRVRK